jgi:hypothetical protein
MGRRTKRISHRRRTRPRHAQCRHRQSSSSRPCRTPKNSTWSPSTAPIGDGPPAAPPREPAIPPSPAACHAEEGYPSSRRTRPGATGPHHNRHAHRTHLPLAGRRSENVGLPFLRTPEIIIRPLLPTACNDCLRLTASFPPRPSGEAILADDYNFTETGSVSDGRHAALSQQPNGDFR